MRWEDERYVRLYTRDSADWLGLSFLAQGLFCLLLRKVDRAGILPLGRAGKKGAAVAVGHGHQWPMLEPALDELLEDGCVRMDGDRLVIPNFIEAQEAIQSDAARKRTQRERDRARVTLRDETVTGRDDESRNGTKSHEMSREVTPSLAVPSLTDPNQEDRRRATTPQGEALDHWNAVVWPALSPSPPPEPGTQAMVTLARRCKKSGLEAVKEAMDRAAEKARSDAWTRENLTLQGFASDSGFTKFMPRYGAGSSPPSRNEPTIVEFDREKNELVLSDGSRRKAG